MEVIRRLATAIRLDRRHPRSAGRRSRQSHPQLSESTHTIQASCDLTVDRRLLPGEDPAAAFAEIAAVAHGVEACRTGQRQAVPRRGEARPVHVPIAGDDRIRGGAGVVRGVASRARVEPETFYSPAAFRSGLSQPHRHSDGELGPGEYKFAHTDFDLASVDRVRDAALVFAASFCAGWRRHLLPLPQAGRGNSNRPCRAKEAVVPFKIIKPDAAPRGHLEPGRGTSIRLIDTGIASRASMCT